jgi:octaprenyl-diphosphate synthase
MRDDYLDLLGDSAVLGKPTGGDLREGKATHAVLQLILDHDSDEARTIVSRHASVDGDVERIVGLVKAVGADAVSRAAIAAECRRAEAALDVFASSPARDALISLVRAEALRVA